MIENTTTNDQVIQAQKNLISKNSKKTDLWILTEHLHSNKHAQKSSLHMNEKTEFWTNSFE